MVLMGNKLDGGVGIQTVFSGPKVFYSAQAIRHREILYGIFKKRSVLFSRKYGTCSDNVFNPFVTDLNAHGALK